VNNDEDDPIFVFKWAVAKVPQEHSASFQVEVTELIERYDYFIYIYESGRMVVNQGCRVGQETELWLVQ